MRKVNPKSKEEFVNNGLKVVSVYKKERISNILLQKKYNINGNDEVFEILFSSNSRQMLVKEEQFIDGFKVFSANCEKLPMNDVYNYVVGKQK